MRRLSLFLACLLWPALSWGAVAHQTTTGYTQSTLANSKTQSFTVSSGSNLCLIVTVGIETASRTVSGITFNGVALTKKSDHSYLTPTPPIRSEIWYLVNPAVTSANVVITIASSQTAIFSGGITSVTGCHQTTPLGTAVESGATAANPSVTVTDGATGDLVLDFLVENWGAVTVGAGQTVRFDNGCLTAFCYHGSTEPGAASVTMSWTHSSADRLLVGINIFQATGTTDETFGFRKRLPQ